MARLEASPSPVYGAALLMRLGFTPLPGSNPGASAAHHPLRSPGEGRPMRHASRLQLPSSPAPRRLGPCARSRPSSEAWPRGWRLRGPGRLPQRRVRGGRKSCELTELPDPVPGPGQVAIDVTYAAVGLVDIYIRQGLYKDRAGLPQPPYVPGLEVGRHHPRAGRRRGGASSVAEPSRKGWWTSGPRSSRWPKPPRRTAAQRTARSGGPDPASTADRTAASSAKLAALLGLW